MAAETTKKDVDQTKMVDEVAKAVKQVNLPGVDVDSLVASQKNNVVAVSANQVAFQVCRRSPSGRPRSCRR